MEDKEYYVIPGCVLAGLGVGMLFDHNSAGLMIGLGIGLLITAVVNSKKEPKKE